MATYHAAAARRRRATGPAPSLTGPASDVHPVLRRATAPPAALDLLAQARAGLDEAAALETSERALRHGPSRRPAHRRRRARRPGAPGTHAPTPGQHPERLGSAPRDRARTRRVERAVRLRSPAPCPGRGGHPGRGEPPGRRRPDTRRGDVPAPRRADAGAPAGPAPAPPGHGPGRGAGRDAAAPSRDCRTRATGTSRTRADRGSTGSGGACPAGRPACARRRTAGGRAAMTGREPRQ